MLALAFTKQPPFVSSKEPVALKADCRARLGSPAALPCRPRSHLAWGPSPEPQQGLLRDEKCQGYLIIPSNSCDPAAIYKPIYLPSRPPSPSPAQPGLRGGWSTQAAAGLLHSARLRRSSGGPAPWRGRVWLAWPPSVLHQALGGVFQSQVGQVRGLQTPEAW